MWSFAIYFLIVGFAIAALNHNVSPFFQKQTLDSEMIKSSRLGQRYIKKAISEAVSLSGYYKLMVISWRLNTEVKKIKRILACQLTIESLRAFDHIIYVFKSLMIMLRPGDEYIGLCDMNFWSNVEFG